MEIVFATGNPNKVAEANALLKSVGHLTIVSLHGKQVFEELPETGNTLLDNARQKARYIRQHYGYDCFSEDTGLEVDALDGEPGVHSARYAGPGRNSEDNIDHLLRKLAGRSDRRARFRTVICLLLQEREYLFEGRVEGHILHERRGTGGFGYDPVFQPDGYEESFAEMSPEQKSRISHRGQAVQKLVEFLRTIKKR
jgi:XTP/dITP diphosphohydrolase